MSTINEGAPYQFEPGSARGIRKEGPWFRDEADRFVLLRGVNLGARAKLPPYLPVYPLNQRELARHPAVLENELARVRGRLAALPALGVNAVRLVLTWKGVEPRFTSTPGVLTPEGLAYLEGVREIVLALKALGLFVFFDFHQDLAHEAYGGDGFPDWALAVDEDHPVPPGPPPPSPGWALNYYDVFLAPVGKQVRHTLYSFWANRLTNRELRQYPVRDHFVRTMGAVAGYFMRHPVARDALLGYEPFNEPHQVGLDPRAFEGQLLPEFYQALVSAIREQDPEALVFLQPRVDWTVFPLDDSGSEFKWFDHTYDPVTVLGMGDEADHGLVFSFHYYDPYLLEQAAKDLRLLKVLAGDTMPEKEEQWSRAFDRMVEAARVRRMVPFLTEYGASQDWEPPDFVTRLRPRAFKGSQAAAYMGVQLALVERYLLNATYWCYDLYNTAEDGDHFNTENFSLLGPDWNVRHAAVFARPYPMRSTAEPELLWFDPETERFALVLKGETVNDDVPTVVFVPRAHHYFKGFEARASAKNVERGLQWDAERGLLYWWPDPDDTEHLLTVCPRGEFDAGELPTRVQQLLTRAVVRCEMA